MKLPIAEFRGPIMSAVRTNKVVLVEGATGSGKTTQVPQYLLDAGFSCVVTQPRRLAARSLAERVVEERGSRLGDEVGYEIAGERVRSATTRCTFVTEGLALVRSLFTGTVCPDVLVVDEWHGRTEDLDILCAWAKVAIAGGARFRLVIMSATMDAGRLSAYFDGAPVITVPGRTFPISIEAPEPLGDSGEGMAPLWAAIAKQTAEFVARGRSVLVFAPGKGEIEDLCGRLGRLGVPALPLHGGLTGEQQRRCFRPHSRGGAIVATNVAETSITIDHIDAVIDSGLERRTEVVSGVQGLYLRLISEANAAQRRGRSGRVKPGISVDYAETIAATPRLARIVAPPTGDVRPKYPVPELQRVLLDRAVLRLAQAGFDLETLPVFDPLDPAEIGQAKRVLRALGCVVDGITVTPMGARVAGLPVGVRQGRMLIEAEDRGCVREALSLAAILEGQGIVDRHNVHPETHVKAGQPVWRDHIVDPTSDHVSFLRLFERAERMPDRGRSIGCHGKAVGDAMELRRRLAAETGKHLKVSHAKPATREDLLACVLVSQIDQFRAYARTDRWGTLWGSDERRLGESTAVSGRPAFVVGVPFDVATKKGGRLSLLQFVSVIDPATVPASAVETKESSPRYDAATDRVVAQVDVTAASVCQYAADRLLSRTDVPVTDTRAPVALVDGIARAISDEYTRDIAESHRDALRTVIEGRSAARDLNARVGAERYPCGSDEQLRAFVASAVGSAVRLADVPVSSFTLEIVSGVEIDRVKTLHPDTMEIAGQSYSVSYAPGSAPLIECSESAILTFPDTLCTPGGRAIECAVRFGWNDQRRTSDIASLKAHAKERASKLIFDDWRDRPTIEDDSIHEYAAATFVAYGCRNLYGSTQWSLSRETIEQERFRALFSALSSEWSALRYDLPYHHPLREEAPTSLNDIEEWQRFVARARAAVAAINAAKAAAEEAEQQGAAHVIAQLSRSDGEGCRLTSCNIPDEDLARRIFRFVRDAQTIMPIAAVASVLRDERDQAYGRGARSSAIGTAFPGVDHQVLDWQKCGDILAVTAYAESLPGAFAPVQAVKWSKSATPAALPQERPEVRTTPTTFADLSAKFGGKKNRK